MHLNINFNRAALRLALFSGLLWAALIPPFQSPDEPNHFFRAWQISEGYFFPEKTADRRLGGVLPESASKCAQAFAGLKGNDTARLTLLQWRAEWARPLRPDARRFTDFANTAIYAPTAYVPQAVGIAVGRLVGLPPLGLLYAARLCNMLCWWGLLWVAARGAAPLFRAPVVIACLPASGVLAASANADVLTNGLCCWLLACWLRSEKPAFAPLAAAGVLICVHKLIVWPLLLLFFTGPGRLPGRQALVLCSLGLAAALSWSAFADRWFIPYDAYHPDFRDSQTLNEGVEPRAQLAGVTAHPFTFLKITAQSAARALPSSAAHLAGKFGWEKNYLPAGWIAALWVVLLWAALSTPKFLSNRQRGLLAIICLLYGLLFALTMYALWHPVGAPEIGNWQGRYFVPVLPLFLWILGGWRAPKQAQWPVYLGFAILFGAQVAMAFEIWERYWVA